MKSKENTMSRIRDWPRRLRNLVGTLACVEMLGAAILSASAGHPHDRCVATFSVEPNDLNKAADRPTRQSGF
jgi:hypothetical protein